MDPNNFDIDAWLNSAKLPERTHQLCLRGDLVADWEQLQRRKKAAATADSLDGGNVADIDAQLEALREEMRAATVELRMRALPRRRWDEIMNGAKPREGNDMDSQFGYDPDAFFHAAIGESIVEPPLTAAQWEKLAEVITEAQYNGLVDVVNALNVREVSIPN